jgi:type II secretory pathway component PulF
MPLFRYQAFDQKGKIISGELEAENTGDLKDLVKKNGFYLCKIYPTNTESLFSKFISILESSVTDKIKIQFTNQLSILLKAGVPLLDAMNLVALQFEGSFRRTLNKIIDDIKEGVSLADALEKYPKIFPSLYTQLVRAGEASGNLEMVLDRLTTFMERSEAIVGSVGKALQKPMFMGIMILLVFIGAVVFIIPSISGTLSQTGKGLPVLTQAMLDLSDFFKNYYLAIGIFLSTAIFFFKRWKNSEKGRVAFDSFLLKLPKIGTLQKNKAVVQFSQTLGMLLEAGVNLPAALDIVNNVVDNAILSQALKVARGEIVKEGKIAKHLKNTNIWVHD